MTNKEIIAAVEKAGCEKAMTLAEAAEMALELKGRSIRSGLTEWLGVNNVFADVSTLATKGTGGDVSGCSKTLDD